MAHRWQLTVVVLCMLLVMPYSTRADVLDRWGNVIPGTEGIEPGPGVQLAHIDLEYAWLPETDLTDADFEASNLANADLFSSTLTNANLTNAMVTGVTLRDSTGFAAEQLYATASYQNHNLQGIDLSGNDLTGWDFSGQNLTDASMGHLFAGPTTLTGANLTGALVTRANFLNTTWRGFTKEQLYSTASYQAKNLQGIILGLNNLTGWNLSDQDLSNADLWRSTLTDAILTGANLKNTNLFSFQSQDLESTVFDSATIYNQWTQFPNGFDPVAAGLTLVPSSAADFDANDALDLADVDLLTAKVYGGKLLPNLYWLPDAMFDLNSDGRIDQEDHRIWVKDSKNTWYGDANLDGEFDSSDFVQAFAAGRYETGWVDEWGIVRGETAGWAEGDWNADGVFSSSDMVAAFADGGYEKGLRSDAVALPEPGSWLLLILGTATLLRVHRKV